MAEFLHRYFRLREHKTTVRAEVLGGVTTFATMAYIVVVNPAILENAGLPAGPSTLATILAAVFGCLLMGLYANRPFAVAPYMGENAFIAFTLGLSLHVPWQQSLAAVFVSGVLFVLLTLVRARAWLASAISPNLKYSFAIGIGLFLLLIGLYGSGVVVSSATAPPLRIGDVREPRVLLALAGFFVMAVLTYWNVRGAILLGIAATAMAGYFLGVGVPLDGVAEWPNFRLLGDVALQLDIAGVLTIDFLPVLLTLFLMSFLDTLGTLYALGAAGGLLDDRGDLPDVQRPMLVDAIACVVAPLLGTTTSGAYIESATGIREGARTGLAAVVVGILFALTLFFLPLVRPLQQLTYAYGPALMLVGVLMFANVRHLRTDDFTELVPAVVAVVMMVFTYNIANGLTAGLIVHPLMKLAAGRWRDLHPAGVVLGLLCLVYYVAGRVH
jgi:AGZA family xanthine/uracil permease-like MFS transporter